MKTITIDRNSWHFKLVTMLGGQPLWRFEAGYVDSCQYNRAIIVGLIKGVLLGCLGLLALFGIASFESNFFAWVAYCLVNEFIDPTTLAIVGTAINSIIGVLFGCVYLEYRYTALKARLRMPKMVTKRTDAIGELYDAMKNKYCKKIKLKES